MTINVFDRILLLGDHATKQEKAIINNLKNENLSDLIYLSITEFSEKMNVAEATILRFCRKLGLKGFSEFRLLLAQNNTQAESIKSEDFAAVIARNMSNAINATYEFLDYKEVEKTVDYILKSNRTYAIGSGNSGIAALELRNKLMRIGVHIDHICDGHFQAIVASTVKEEDVFILFSVTGATKDMIDVAKLVKQQGGKVIVVTNYLKSPLSNYADALLYVVVKDAPLDGGSLVSKVSQLYIIDVLSSLIYKKLGKQAEENLRKTADAVLDKGV